MDFNIIKIVGLISLIICYIFVRRFFKRVANYTETAGEALETKQEMEGEIKRLNNKIASLEEQLKK